MYQFSSGSLYGINPNGFVPRKFGALQDISVDISFTKKSLYGQNQFALAIARGQGKLTGKAKFARINSAMLNDLFFAQSLFAGSRMPIFGEAGTVPAVSTFIVTVANSATFFEDLGVVYTTTGKPLTRVVAGPIQGQYSVAAGVYTFAAADANAQVLIDYTFTVSASGSNISLSQQLSGTTPTFGIILVSKYQAPGDATQMPLYVNLSLCMSDKLSLATKMDDFMVPEFDFEAMANAAGSVGSLYLGE